MRKWFLALVLAAALLGAGCGQMGQKDTDPQTVSRPAVQSAERQFAALTGGETVAVFDTSAGVFKAVLYPDLAPQACDNFIGLVNKGFYNGLTITRVEKDFVVSAGQGADGKGTTIWGGSRYPAEYTDSLHHYSGALCAAADASGDCASVFYVVQTPPDAVSQELTDQMTAAGYRPEVIAAYQAAGGAPYLDYGDTGLARSARGWRSWIGSHSPQWMKKDPWGADHNQQCKPGLLRGPGGKPRTIKKPRQLSAAGRAGTYVCAERVRDDRMPLRKVLSGQRGAGSILLAGVILAPCQIIFQDHRGADCIQDGFALFAKGAVVPQDAGGGDGGLALIPHPHRQSALLLHDGSQLAVLLGTGALGAVHVPGQPHHDLLGTVSLGGFADLCGYLDHGFFFDLGL